VSRRILVGHWGLILTWETFSRIIRRKKPGCSGPSGAVSHCGRGKRQSWQTPLRAKTHARNHGWEIIGLHPGREQLCAYCS